MTEYGIVNKKTNKVVHTFKAENNQKSTCIAMNYLLGLGLAVTTVKATFKVVGFITNKGTKK